MDVSALKQAAWDEIRAREEVFRVLALEILEHPELGYRERRASRRLSESLAEAGLEVDRPYGGLETAFRGRRTAGDGPAVYFLAEYDALPEIGHGCGHNLIGPAAALAAAGAAAVLDELGGTVGVIGTPAEEYAGEEEGKVKLLDAGAFEHVDIALMLHPYSAYQLLGSDLGFIACNLHYRGKTAHAAADPWAGRNALDGLLAAFQGLNALRGAVPPDVRIHGVITDGGRVPNVIPEYAAGQFMVRAADPGTLHEVYERFCACARAGAEATGTEVEIERITTVYNTRPNPALAGLIEDHFQQRGLDYQKEPYRMSASSDFGNVSQRLPAAMFFIASHPEGLTWHTRQVAEAAGEERALRAMVEGACVLAGAAVELLADPGLVQQVRKDFERYER